MIVSEAPDHVRVPVVAELGARVEGRDLVHDVLGEFEVDGIRVAAVRHNGKIGTRGVGFGA